MDKRSFMLKDVSVRLAGFPVLLAEGKVRCFYAKLALAERNKAFQNSSCEYGTIDFSYCEPRRMACFIEEAARGNPFIWPP